MNEITMILLSVMAVCVIVVCIAVLIELNIKVSFMKGDWYEEMLDRTMEYYFKKLPEWADKISGIVNQMFKLPDDDTTEDEDEG